MRKTNIINYFETRALRALEHLIMLQNICTVFKQCSTSFLIQIFSDFFGNGQKLEYGTLQ